MGDLGRPLLCWMEKCSIEVFHHRMKDISLSFSFFLLALIAEKSEVGKDGSSSFSFYRVIIFFRRRADPPSKIRKISYILRAQEARIMNPLLVGQRAFFVPLPTALVN